MVIKYEGGPKAFRYSVLARNKLKQLQRIGLPGTQRKTIIAQGITATAVDGIAAHTWLKAEGGVFLEWSTYPGLPTLTEHHYILSRYKSAASGAHTLRTEDDGTGVLIESDPLGLNDTVPHLTPNCHYYSGGTIVSGFGGNRNGGHTTAFIGTWKTDAALSYSTITLGEPGALAFPKIIRDDKTEINGPAGAYSSTTTSAAEVGTVVISCDSDNQTFFTWSPADPETVISTVNIPYPTWLPPGVPSLRFNFSKDGTRAVCTTRILARRDVIPDPPPLLSGEYENPPTYGPLYWVGGINEVGLSVNDIGELSVTVLRDERVDYSSHYTLYSSPVPGQTVTNIFNRGLVYNGPKKGKFLVAADYSYEDDGHILREMYVQQYAGTVPPIEVVIASGPRVNYSVETLYQDDTSGPHYSIPGTTPPEEVFANAYDRMEIYEDGELIEDIILGLDGDTFIDRNVTNESIYRAQVNAIDLRYRAFTITRFRTNSVVHRQEYDPGLPGNVIVEVEDYPIDRFLYTEVHYRGGKLVVPGFGDQVDYETLIPENGDTRDNVPDYENNSFYCFAWVNYFPSSISSGLRILPSPKGDKFAIVGMAPYFISHDYAEFDLVSPAAVFADTYFRDDSGVEDLLGVYNYAVDPETEEVTITQIDRFKDVYQQYVDEPPDDIIINPVDLVNRADWPYPFTGSYDAFPSSGVAGCWIAYKGAK